MASKQLIACMSKAKGDAKKIAACKSTMSKKVPKKSPYYGVEESRIEKKAGKKPLIDFSSPEQMKSYKRMEKWGHGKLLRSWKKKK